MARDLMHFFAAGADDLWAGLCAALPAVTQQATFWPPERRVQWVTEVSGWSWTQVFSATVESPSDGSASLRMRLVRRTLPALGDRRRRRHIFAILVDAIDDALTGALPAPPATERVLRWNGAWVD
jgi:hypothetical protein